MEQPEFVKTISDPLYGSIPLTKVEVAVIDTPVFQRLRRVAQLGLVELVFPSATYTRFSHCIGACHVMGMILNELDKQEPMELKEWQEHRLAMLLHDVGHYFMSHTTEHALKAYFQDKGITTSDGSVDVTSKPAEQYLRHEPLGKHILRSDVQLKVAMDGYDAERIAEIFNSEVTTRLSNLVTSDLDADRLDYLMRSSQATGLPYGHYDRDFILRNLCYAPLDLPAGDDLKQFVCVREKAVRAADHFLLCRLFDFLQVIYQKTVVGMELMMSTAIQALMRTGSVKLGKAELERAITDGAWNKMDDRWIWERLAKAHAKMGSQLNGLEQEVVRRLVLRDPPPLLYSYERIRSAGGEDGCQTHQNYFDHVIKKGTLLSETCLTWRKNFSLMKVRTHSFADETLAPDEVRQTIHVAKNRKAIPIFKIQHSLAAALGDHEYEMARVYFVGPDSKLTEAKTEVERTARDWKLPGLLL